MSEHIKTYTKDELTVVWKPDLCTHSRLCWTGLREVFNPTQRPWININAADTEKIIRQVKQCPSGALSYLLAGHTRDEPTDPAPEGKIEIQSNGPILITTDCHIQHSDGRVEIRKGKTALCRCGASGNKPFCDGSHRSTGFTG